MMQLFPDDAAHTLSTVLMPVYRWLTEVSCYKWSAGANSLNPILLRSFGSVPSFRRGTKSCFDHLSFSQNLAILCIGVVAVLCIETGLSIEIVAGFDAPVVVCMKLLSITCTVDHCVCCSQWLLLALGLGGGHGAVLFQNSCSRGMHSNYYC